METKKSWFTLNVLLPLLPLLLRGAIKILMDHLSLETISSSELWFVLALISLLIVQDLKLRHVPLDNDEKKGERHDRATNFIVLCIICVFFCPICEIFHVLVDVDTQEKYYYAYAIVTFFTYLFALFLLKYVLQTQTEFNLRAKFF